MISWCVDHSVPETILIDERDLAKMISCVFLNAIKFTDEGSIILRAYLKPRTRYIIISIADTGAGIPEAFRPNLFKPFSKEDHSLTRQSEGLGLGLLVARGLARKLGGDIICIRSETSGPSRGTQFEMRIPVTPVDSVSRQITPLSSPSPSLQSHSSSSLANDASHKRHYSQDYFKIIPKSSSRSSPPHAAVAQPAKPSPANHSPPKPTFDRLLAERHPLTFLVVEDNKINRRLLVNMLKKMGYLDIYEAYDGADAVRKMEENVRLSKPSDLAELSEAAGTNPRRPSAAQKPVEVILMDLWMPYMDGYEAAERILAMDMNSATSTPGDAPILAPGLPKIEAKRPTILAVTADATDGALDLAAKAGMKGFLTKPYKMRDLERLILEYCATRPTAK